MLYKVNFRFMSKFSHLKPDLASSQYPRNDGCYFDQIAKLPKRFSEASGAMIWAHPNALPLNTWGMFEIIICFTVLYVSLIHHTFGNYKLAFTSLIFLLTFKLFDKTRLPVGYKVVISSCLKIPVYGFMNFYTDI